jgi:hypothetical protein
MDFELHIKVLSFHWNISISKQWIRFAIIVAVVAASTVIPYWGSRQLLMLVLVLLGGIALILVLLQKPNLGFILIFMGGMFVPFTGPSGINAAVLMVALLLGLWLLDMLVVKRYFSFISSRVLLPVTVFLVISVLAFGMGQISWFTFANQAPLDAQAGGFAIFVLSVGALLVAAHFIQDERWLRIIVWSFIALGAIYILGRAASVPQIDRLYQRGFSAGSMFWTWLVAMAFSQVVFNIKLRTRLRILLGLLVLLTIYVAYVQGNDWKSGWVPPILVIAVLLGLRYKRMLILAIPVALIAVVYVAGILIASDEYSWGTRVDAWIIVLEISRVNPLLGLGFSNYYWYTPLFPIRGWSVNFNSHSQYVDLIAQVGLLGLLCFLWIFFEAGKLSWRLSGELPDGFARSYSYGVLAGIIGSLLAAFLVDWILPFVYNIGFSGFRASILPWIFIGGLISIEQMYRSNQNPTLARST